MTREAPGFFDIDDRLAELSAKGDDLERLSSLVDFELFQPSLEIAVPRGDRSKGGRPPFDHVLMFRVLILQAMHALSDERSEYLIKDRLSFMRFLGLDVPLNFHQATIRVSAVNTPEGGADVATGVRRSWSGLRSRSPVAVRLV